MKMDKKCRSRELGSGTHAVWYARRPVSGAAYLPLLLWSAEHDVRQCAEWQ